jgi:hypothetical protein
MEQTYNFDYTPNNAETLKQWIRENVNRPTRNHYSIRILKFNKEPSIFNEYWMRLFENGKPYKCVQTNEEFFDSLAKNKHFKYSAMPKTFYADLTECLDYTVESAKLEPKAEKPKAEKPTKTKNAAPELLEILLGPVEKTNSEKEASDWNNWSKCPTCHYRINRHELAVNQRCPYFCQRCPETEISYLGAGERGGDYFPKEYIKKAIAVFEASKLAKY